MLLRLQVVEALENVDRILGLLMDGLTQRDLQRCVNMIIISDHGEITTQLFNKCDFSEKSSQNNQYFNKTR